MAAAAGFFNHQSAAQSLLGKAAPMSTPTSGASATSDASDDSATISANDFLTLLVTEMQNQDPTADTDPNEYINQLVQVNSLEQLININQTLTTDLGAPSDGSSPSTETAGSAANPAAASSASTPAHSAAAVRNALGTAAPGEAESPMPAVYAPGNLSVPAPNASAQRVAHALDGRTRGPTAVAGAL